jgi:biotin carboxyl carrier protein
MTFEVEVEGRIRTVVVERGDNPSSFRVQIDGQPGVVDAVRAGDHSLSILGRVTFLRNGGRERGTLRIGAAVQVTAGTAPGEGIVHLNGRTIRAVINGRRRRAAADEGAHGPGDVIVAAPMPGRIVRVLVAPGDQVTPRQALVVVEAMKMEHTLTAPSAGTVDLSVRVGDQVALDQELAVVHPSSTGNQES